jgi:hypothetical protein
MNGPDISRRLWMKKYEEVGVQLWAAVKLPIRQGLYTSSLVAARCRRVIRKSAESCLSSIRVASPDSENVISGSGVQIFRL